MAESFLFPLFPWPNATLTIHFWTSGLRNQKKIKAVDNQNMDLNKLHQVIFDGLLDHIYLFFQLLPGDDIK